MHLQNLCGAAALAPLNEQERIAVWQARDYFRTLVAAMPEPSAPVAQAPAETPAEAMMRTPAPAVVNGNGTRHLSAARRPVKP
jgi:hypothetical protein